VMCKLVLARSERTSSGTRDNSDVVLLFYYQEYINQEYGTHYAYAITCAG
jgi:hypothetical protein